MNRSRSPGAVGFFGSWLVLSSVSPVSCSSADTGAPNAEIVIADGTLLGTPKAVALQGETVYFATDEEIFTAPFAGGVKPDAFIHGQKVIVDLAVDARAAYWATLGTEVGEAPGHEGTIFMQPLSGGAPVLLADHQDIPEAVAVDGTRVYWTGGDHRDLTDPPTAYLMSVSLEGGVPSVLASGFALAGPVAARGGTVVFAMSDDTNPTLSHILRLDASGVARELATTDRYVDSIQLDETNVYWADADTEFVDARPNDGRIRSVPLAGGSATVLAEHQSGPHALVASEDQIFWANFGGFFNTLAENTGAVWRVPRAGGAPVAEIAARASVGAFAANVGHLAWIESSVNAGAVSTSLLIRSR